MSNPERERITGLGGSTDRARFGAAWLAGYAAALAGARMECLSLGGFVGPPDVMDAAGSHYPPFDMARWLARAAGWRRVACRSARADRVVGVGTTDMSGVSRVLVVNLTGGPLIARVAGKEPLWFLPFARIETTIG